MIKFETFLIVTCTFLIFLILIKPKIEETFENKQNIPDDLFTDGLDNNMGLNKVNRHHSF